MLNKSGDMEESMSQIVPSAGFTPPCDYTNFADTFDLSLLPGGDLPLSPSTNFYTQSPPPPQKVYTYFPDSPPQEKPESDLGPDFQKLLAPPQSPESIYLEVPSAKNYHANSPIGALTPYSPQLLSPNVYHHPQSPDVSLYNSPVPSYTSEEYIPNAYIKKEVYPNSPAYYPEEEKIQIDESNVFELLGNTLLDKQIKQESTVDFGALLQPFPEEHKKIKVEDHQLLREVLRDTSFQKKFNIKTFDFGFELKMEEPDENVPKELCEEQIPRENIDPVLKLAIQQMRKDMDNTCSILGISADPSQWNQAHVLAWLEWTSREFNLPPPLPEQWEINGTSLVCLSENDFLNRSSQGGPTLYAQLEIWKAAYLDDNLNMWLPETTSNTSSGDVSDEEDEEMQPSTSAVKPPASRPTGGSHIHLWQFLKELLSQPQMHGSCIRWLDRSKGVFKIEDSVKVARLWGKRKNRPAMNYDKLSRSIRQYYKKGIMKKTERSQRLVYQFCHPYCL